MPAPATDSTDRTPLRVFLAGATGVIGIRLLPLLVAAGHTVAGMTRSAESAQRLRGLGADPVVQDVFDAAGLADAVTAFEPDVVVHQLTDLPDRVEEIAAYVERNNRIRSEGTRNLIAAARAAGARHLLAQSIAWTPPGAGPGVAEHERQVLDAGGLVVRYGQLYGPGTYYEDTLPTHPRIHVDDAARATVPLIGAPAGIVSLVDEEDEPAAAD